MLFLTGPVLIFQALVIATILAARLHSRRASLIAALCWSTTTVILVFMPWLMALQLAVIWGSRHLFASNDALELPREGPARTYAAVAAVCLFLAPFFLPMYGIAAFAGWRAWRRRDEGALAALPTIPLHMVTPGTEDWQGHYARVCDSPAEVAFLRAMIGRHRMMPDAGVLRGDGIQLEMQKPLGRYRADFVVDDRLVVEIDGARYHSSVDARLRDGRRDRDLADMGMPTLRIPAKTVFRHPETAMRMVEDVMAGMAVVHPVRTGMR